MGTTATASQTYAKLLPLPALLLGQPAPATVIAVSTLYGESQDVARERLQAFLDAMQPSIDAVIDQAAEPPSLSR